MRVNTALMNFVGAIQNPSSSADTAHYWTLAALLTLFLWIAAMAIGPARLLLVASFGNLKVVGYRHLPARERHQKWELWIALPGAAYIASLISGLAASLMVTGHFTLGMLTFEVGFFGLVLLGVFWGMQGQPRGIELERQETPSAFLAELEAFDQNEIPEENLIRRARLQLDQLSTQSEPDWFVDILAQLQLQHELTSKDAPQWGFKSWRTGPSETVVVPRSSISRVAAHSPTLWASIVGGLIVLCVATTFSLQVGWPGGWPGALALGVVLFLAAAPIVAAPVAARADFIYRTRLWLADREAVARADAVIGRWERYSDRLDNLARVPGNRLTAALMVLLGRRR